MKLSIAIPVYKSALILPSLMAAIDEERLKHHWQLEVILVDDGGGDESYHTLCRLQKQYPYLSAIRLARNFGHQAALRVALERCQGEMIAVIDDDLQDPPHLLASFIFQLQQGYDVVYGIRAKRQEGFLKIFLYKSFYRVLKILSEVDIPLDSGDFCVMKRAVLESMLLLEERNLFLRGARSWVGWKQLGVEYERAGRYCGDSGYTFKKLMNIACDGIISFSYIPLRMIIFLGIIGLGLTLTYALVLNSSAISLATPLLISFFGSLNLFCLGIIGEYLSKIYTEGKKRPHAVIAEESIHQLKEFMHERNYPRRRHWDQALSTDH